MRHILSTSAFAVVLGLTGPALAQSQLEIEAQNLLETHGYEAVDVSSLTTDQLVQFQALQTEDINSPTTIQNRIDVILSMDEGTMSYVSADMTALLVEPQSELKANARELLDAAGYETVDVDTLTQTQLVEFWALAETDVVSDPAALESRVEVILSDS